MMDLVTALTVDRGTPPAWALALTGADDMTDSQVTAFCNDSLELERILAKRRDLLKLDLVDDGRSIITDVTKRRRKMAVETGWDDRTGTAYSDPLEPWTCPNDAHARVLYQRIALADDGDFNVADFLDPADLDHLGYMKAERLVTFDMSGAVHLLSDPSKVDNRSKYPGAPVPDDMASIGRQLGRCPRLRDYMRGAVFRVASNLGVIKLTKDERAKVDRGVDGIGLPVRAVCAEFNAFKARTPELAEYRYLSYDTCARFMRAMLEEGELEEQVAPKAVRVGRQWHMVGRSYTRECIKRLVVPVDCLRPTGPPPPRLREFGELPEELAA